MSTIPFRDGTHFFNCDVLVSKQTNGNSYGHACIVYDQSTLGNSSTMNQHINAAQTFDAWGEMANDVDEIAMKNMSTYWTSSNIQYRYLLQPAVSLTSIQKNTIRTYSINQDPNAYSWSTALGSESVWHYSKLVWRAYKQIGRYRQ